MNKKEILRILDEHADKNYGDIYVSQHQEIAKDLLKYFKKQLLIQRVSQRSEPFAEQDSKDFILWQRDRDIHRESNDCYRWREFKYNRQFFLEKYLEDRNKANCG